MLNHISLYLLIILVFYGLLVGVESRECPGSRFGSGCRFKCHCRDQASCNGVHGECPTSCAAGWSGPVCQRQNVAYLAPVEVRKVNTTGRQVVDEDESTCIATRPDRTGWLKVDLGSSKLVYSMKLVADYNTSIIGWRVHVTDYNHDDLFWSHPCTTLKSQDFLFHCDSPVYGRYVSIFSYDRPVVVCDFRIFGCANYTYGEENCDGRCSCYNSDEVCHPIYGTCQSGCKAGFTGSACEQECVMSYGSNCVNTCGHCKNGASCGKATGACPSGCDPGYTGTMCNEECRSGYYGNSCRSVCGHCNHGNDCNHITGYCSRGCESGWYGFQCSKECSRGSYGEDCKFTCHNCHGSLCDRLTGVCTAGCVSGWEGVFCNQACLNGNYGENCRMTCANCAIQPCSKYTGSCEPHGCLPGYYGDTCIHECPAGKFGSNCKYSCGMCKGGLSCDPKNGSCSQGCDIGRIGDDCSSVCEDGMFGINCNTTCGICEGRLPCNYLTGKCEHGCAEGFHGEFCSDTVGEVSNTVSNAVTSTFIAAVSAIVFLFLGLLCFCVIIKWRQEQNFEDYDHRAKGKLLQNSNGHV